MTDIIDRLERYAGGTCLSTMTELAAAAEIKKLRAEVEAMKQQKPVARVVRTMSGQIWLEDAQGGSFDLLSHLGANLYLAPGAQADLNLACPSVQARLATQWGYVKKGDAQAAPSVPDESSAYAMGAKGGPVVEAERLAFEAWMKGHCWALNAEWDGNSYRGKAEIGQHTDYRAMQTRLLWAAWRDRAALAAAPKPEEG